MTAVSTSQPLDNGATGKDGPELVVGVVCAVGTDLDLVCDAIRESLLAVNYKIARTIHLIELIHDLDRWAIGDEHPEDARYEWHMTAGDQLRETFGRGDALALLAVGAIRETREKATGYHDKPISRGAYLIRSLKNPAEVSMFRRIYGPQFVLVAAYSSREKRLRYLAGKIAQSHHNVRTDGYRSTAERLIERDRSEGGKDFGQNVSSTFPLADVFLNADDPDQLRNSSRRFIEILFGSNRHTPTRDEFGMFHAKGASLRSSSLARQVGAVVTTPEGDIVAVGTNEVPKAGGGLYWSGDIPDHRDIAHGYDPSDNIRKILLADILRRLSQAEWLSKEKTGKDIDELVNEALSSGPTPLLKDAHVRNLIEFARAVHAEMAAFMNAARRGVSIEGCTLYTTTFPCHDCSKHIVAAGIKRAVYIEPYPKSLTPELYPDSISVDDQAGGGQVLFQSFVGIAPRMYMDLFEETDRKGKDGRLRSWNAPEATPRLIEFPHAHLARLVIEEKEFTKFQEDLENH
jgi:deoxycytidylate deaminase